MLLGSLFAQIVGAIVSVVTSILTFRSARKRERFIGILITIGVGIVLLAIAVILLVTGIKEYGIEPVLTPTTSMYYSTGSEDNWTYGDQRKEFPIGKSCYFRADILVDSNNSKGNERPITIKMTFTGTDNCAVQVSDSKGLQDTIVDDNSTTYIFEIPAKKNNEDYTPFVFKYYPIEAGDVSVDIAYYDKENQLEVRKSSVSFVQS